MAANPEGVTDCSPGCQPWVTITRREKSIGNPEAGRRGAQRATRGDMTLCVVHPSISPLAALWASRLPASGFPIPFAAHTFNPGLTPWAMVCHPYGVRRYDKRIVKNPPILTHPRDNAAMRAFRHPLLPLGGVGGGLYHDIDNPSRHHDDFLHLLAFGVFGGAFVGQRRLPGVLAADAGRQLDGEACLAAELYGHGYL